MENELFGGFQSVAEGLSKLDSVQNSEGGVSIIGQSAFDEEEDIIVDLSEEEEAKRLAKEEEEEAERLAEEEEAKRLAEEEGLTEEEVEAARVAKEEEEEEEAKKLAEEEAKKGKTKKDKEETTSDLGDDEPEIAAYVQEKIFKKFDLEIDGDAFKEFQSIDDIVDFVDEAIKVNSIPEFASPEVKDIDTYVRDGGDLSQFMGFVHGNTDLDNVDLEDESTQKSLIKEDLKNQGLSDTRIKRKLERMEDTGVLEDEAEDALDALKEFRETEKERLLKEQENFSKLQKENNLKFVNQVEDELETLDNIRGIDITQIEKNRLLTYIFKPTVSGETAYQKEYKSNVKNLLESAYFTMKGKTLVTKVEKKAESKAAKKLKTKLANKGNRGKNQVNHGTSRSDVWSNISRKLR